MTESDNQSTGPRTDEGKQRSSQNALKHGLFSTKSFLLPGESQEEFDKLLYRYNRHHQPKGPIEEDLVLHLAHTEWRRRRIPALEVDSIERSLESGDPERKFMHTYSIYDQRFLRLIQSTLKTLGELQAKRKKETAIQFRIAVVLYKYNKTNYIPWNPADDGFVFSPDLLGRQLSILDRIVEANDKNRAFATEDEIDAFIAKDAM